MELKIVRVDAKHVNINGLTQDQVYYLVKDTFEAIKKCRKEDSMLFDVHPNRDLLFDLMNHFNALDSSALSLIKEIKEFYNSL